MIDLTQIGVMMNSLNAAKNIAEAMVGLRDTEMLQAKRLEFQSELLKANAAAFAANEERASLIQTIRDLEAKVREFEQWDVEKQRYELEEFRPGLFAYALKPSEARGEPQHSICAKCYEEGKKSILQGNKLRFAGRETIRCQRCSSEMSYYRSELPPAPMLTPRQSTWMGR